MIKDNNTGFEFEDIMNMTKDLKLLYVEDDKIARDATLAIFEEFFDNIIVGVDGIDGLNKFNKDTFDIIITDLNMPNMSGLEMLKEIRKVSNDIPVIVLSAHNEDEYKIGSIKTGTSTFLSKPINLEKFLTSIYEALNHSLRDMRVLNDDDIVLEKYKDKIDINSIVSIFDSNGIIIYVNESFCDIFGYTKEQLIGRPYYTLTKEKRDHELIDEIWTTIKIKKEPWHGTIRYVNNFDKVYFLKGIISPILNKYNKVIEYVAIREDITIPVHEEMKKYQ